MGRGWVLRFAEMGGNSGAWMMLCALIVGTHGLAVPSTAPVRRNSPVCMMAPTAVASAAPAYELHEAAAEGDSMAVDLLLSAGLDCEARNAKASTPLHMAALNGHNDVAEMLLNAGASVDATNQDGNTPLHAAVLKGQLEVAQLLISRGANAEVALKDGVTPMRVAARRGDSAMISALASAGATMDGETAQVAFWKAVQLVESTAEDEALSVEVPRLMRHVIDADMRSLREREKITQNVTCKSPVSEGGVAGASAGLGYIFDHGEHVNLPLKEGRKCEGGECCEACSRNTFPAFALPAETDLEVFPELEKFNFNEVARCSASTILNFLRLVERVRRTIAHEYGLPLSTVLPLQAYSRKYVAGKKQSGGGGAEGDSVILHTDEATHAGYHYSCVMYLSTQGEDFTGGSFVWNDPKPLEPEVAAECEVDAAGEGDGAAAADGEEDEERRAKCQNERVLTEFAPQRGAAVIFSSGWENMHEVWKLESGTRYAVPCFFTTCPVPESALDELGGIPKGDEAIADDLWYLLLSGRRENPIESAGRVKELLMKWHYLLAPEPA